MLDLSHIPSQQQNTTIFYAQSGSWQTWNKPRNAKMIEIFCLGGGGGVIGVFLFLISNFSDEPTKT